MSYYLLPSKNTPIEISLLITESPPFTSHVSPSLDYHKEFIKDQLKVANEEMKSLDTSYSLDFFQQSINPYEYIFTKVPGTKFSVGKMKPQSPSFYVFFEMINILNLFDAFQHRNIKTFLHGTNAKSMNDCIDILRENYHDTHVDFHELTSSSNLFRSIDFLYFEFEENIFNETKFCVKKIITFLTTVLQFQSENGITVVKIPSISYKPILDMIYIMTSLYEKIYIIKPNASDLFDSEKFLVCKNYNFSLETIQYYLRELYSILESTSVEISIESFVKKALPYYFLTKIEEANIIIGHQQLEIVEQMINLIKNKNREEKLESLKKNNIQKCIQWCEKYKIPYNKFSDKVNIFLNSTALAEGSNEKLDDAILDDESLLYP